MNSAIDSLLLQAVEDGCRPTLDALTRPLRELTNESSTLVIGYGIGQPGVREAMIPYFHIIGPDRGHPPLRMLIVGGWSGHESFTPLAIARFLALIENQPDHIAGCEITAYPVANLPAYKNTPQAPEELAHCWKNLPTGHTRVIENELQRYPYDIAVLLVEQGQSGIAEFWEGHSAASGTMGQALAELQPQPTPNPDFPCLPRLFTPIPLATSFPCELHLGFPEAAPSRQASEGALAALMALLKGVQKTF